MKIKITNRAVTRGARGFFARFSVSVLSALQRAISLMAPSQRQASLNLSRPESGLES